MIYKKGIFVYENYVNKKDIIALEKNEPGFRSWIGNKYKVLFKCSGLLNGNVQTCYINENDYKRIRRFMRK